MMLYTKEAWSENYASEPQLAVNIFDALATSNEAMVRSEISMDFNLIHLGQVSAG